MTPDLHPYVESIQQLSELLHSQLRSAELISQAHCGELFEHYVGQLEQFLGKAEQSVYRDLLKHDRPRLSRWAERQIDSAGGIRDHLQFFLATWWSRSEKRFKLQAKDPHYSLFMLDMNDLMHAVERHLHRESKQFQPLHKHLQQNREAA